MSEPTPLRPIEQLASALQECLEEAANNAADRAVAKLGPHLDRMDQRLDGMDRRLDRQDETLRMVWKQVKGNGALPID